jgi:hypothetical protein
MERDNKERQCGEVGGGMLAQKGLFCCLTYVRGW